LTVVVDLCDRTFAPESGNADYDIRNRFTLSMRYQLPAVPRHCKWEVAGS
jgi:hypothetical protein